MALFLLLNGISVFKTPRLCRTEMSIIKSNSFSLWNSLMSSGFVPCSFE